MLWVIFIRLLGPTIIWRYPLFGSLLAIVLDYFDLNILTYLEPNSLDKYQYLDKILDFYYLGFEAYFALFFWKNIIAKSTALTLFLDRSIGVILFALTGYEPILVLFPNVFEYFFIFYLLQLKLFKKDHLQSLKKSILIVILLAMPKIAHEYLLHVNTTHPWSENYYVKKITDPDFIKTFAK
jgi:hypothetical protein